MIMEIKIPNLGDGIDSAVVISILVAPGDTVTKDQTLIELETDKAVAPVPSPQAGTVESISVKEGDTVSMGSLIGHFKGGASSSSNEKVVATRVVSDSAPLSSAQFMPMSSPSSSYQPSSGVAAPTSPSIRKLAERVGLDLSQVQPTGSGGRITEQDLMTHVHFLQSSTFRGPLSVESPMPSKVKTSLPDFSKWGEIKIEKVSSLRQKIADKMAQCWSTIPHVTQQQDVDITDLMDLRKKYNPNYKKAGSKLTLTVFALKAVQQALKTFPQFNASYDEEKQELIIVTGHTFFVKY